MRAVPPASLRTGLAVLAICAMAHSGFAQSMSADVPPEPIRIVAASIPPDARGDDHLAVVRVRLRIDVTGSVSNATVVQSAGRSVDDAVVAALRASRFRPARHDGAAVDGSLEYEYRFASAPSPPPPPPRSLAHLHGLVRDTHDREVRHAVLMFGDDGVMHVLDEGESFSFDVDAPRHLVMYVFAPGYRTLHAERDVHADDDVYVVFRLAPLGESHATPSHADLTIRGRAQP